MAIKIISLLFVMLCTYQRVHADITHDINGRDVLIRTARLAGYYLKECERNVNNICTHKQTRHWRADRNGEGFMRFRMNNRNLCTEGDGRTTVFGTGDPHRCQWRVRQVAGGTMYIISNRASGFILDCGNWELHSCVGPFCGQFSRTHAYPTYTGTPFHHWYFE